MEIRSILGEWGAELGVCGAVEVIAPASVLADGVPLPTCTEREQAIASGFRHIGRRAAWVSGRAAARQAVASWNRRMGHCVADAEILRADSGAPLIAGRSDLHLSISHSGGWAIAVVADRPLGVDLETLDERSDALERTFFSESERRWVAKTDEARRVRCNIVWTRKEAVSKLLGRGGDLVFARLPVLDGETPWMIDSRTTSIHALSIALGRGA